jgi:disintegrin and metalloproteinase domain-containing protein 10
LASHSRVDSRCKYQNLCLIFGFFLTTFSFILIQHNDANRAAIVDEKAKEEILSLVAHHVAAVNFIYRNTKFDGRVEHRNIRFEVQRIKIDDDAACATYYRGEANQFCMENIDVSNFLNLHSLGNHEHFCLAYVFTYRYISTHITHSFIYFE